MAGLFSYDANDPDSYATMELRRKIALQLLARDNKKGYPKNIGEGLTSIGDALGDIGMMRMLQSREAAYQAHEQALQKQRLDSGDLVAPAQPSTSTGDRTSDTAVDVPVRTARAPIDDPVVQDAIVRKSIADDSKPEPTETQQEPPPAPSAPTVVATAPPTRSVQPQSPTWTDIQVKPAPGVTRPPLQTAPVPASQVPDPRQLPPPGANPNFQTPNTALDIPRGVLGTQFGPRATPSYGGSMQRTAGWLPGSTESYNAYPGGLDSLSSRRVAGGFQDMGTGASSGNLTERMLQNAGTARRLADYGATRTPATQGPPTAGPPTEQQYRQLMDTGLLRAAPNTLGGSANTLALNPNITSPGGGTASPIPSTLQRPPEISPTSVAQAPPLSGAVGGQAYSPRDIADEARLSEVMGSRGGGGSYSYPPTASLGRGGNVQSDVPPVTGVSSRVGDAVSDTVQQRRDAITKELMQQEPVKEVPQENPTQAGPTAPMTSSTSPTLGTTTSEDLGSPEEAANNRPIVSDVRAMPAEPVPVPGAQMAQARSTQVPAPMPAPQPQLKPGAPEPEPDIPRKPGSLPAMTPEPKTKQQILDEKSMLFADSPTMKAFYKNLVDQQEAARKEREAVRMKKWEADSALRQQQMLQYDEYQRGLKERQARTSKAQSEASGAADKAVLEARTGLPADIVIAQFQKDKAGAERDAFVLKQTKLAKEALNSGVITGFGAEFRINMERAKALFGDKSANELAARSQEMQAAVKSTIGNALQNVQPGDTRVTEGDIKIAGGLIGADPALQRATQEKLINLTLEASHQRLNKYEENKDTYLGGLKPEKMFDVRVDRIHPDPAVADAWRKKLIQNKDNQEAIRQFDDKFGPGAAQLEIDRERRRVRRIRGD